MKRYHDQGNAYKGKHFIEDGLHFPSSVHHHHGGKHGRDQADMVLEEPRVLPLDPKAARRRVDVSHWAYSKLLRSQSPTSIVIHFL